MPHLHPSTGHDTDYDAVLRNTLIRDDTPGSILHDFQVILEFLDEVPVQLTDSFVLPMKALRPLNERLVRRIEHGLARPQQKSYPHINGLFLLARASGLTLVDITGRKPALEVDPLVEESWRTLNPDERYFTLLESWLMRGDSAIIGEERGRFDMQSPLHHWSQFFRSLERQEWHHPTWIERVRYWPGLHNLALMELFGLVTIEDAPAEAQKGWQIADVRATKWGEALHLLLSTELTDNEEFWERLSQPQDTRPGELQRYIQPYRPLWQHPLQLPETGFQEGRFVFKVSLGKDLWREIMISGQSTLDDFSEAILEAYGFDNDHLYRYLYPSRFGITSEIYHPYARDGMFGEAFPSTDEVRIGDLPAQPGFQMIFNFDFGDNWHFYILLERIEPPDPKAELYQIGNRRGEAPEQYPMWDDSDDWDNEIDDEMDDDEMDDDEMEDEGDAV